MTLSRRESLGLLACAPLAACGNGGAITVGSKNFTESFVIAEIYAQALERAGMRVARRFNLGSTEIALAALRRGDVDLYPEYTGTALIDVLHLPPMHDPQAMFAKVAAEFSRLYDLTWLQPSPMNDSQGLATTRAISQRWGLRTLSDLAPKAPQLRFATIQEFLSRPDGLPGLQRTYGGFAFAQVKTYDIALKYQALTEGKADVASAFTTDGEIATDALVVLRDDRGLWPPYNVAPVVRTATLHAHPRIGPALDAVAPAITDAAARQMNAAVESGRQDPAGVARQLMASTPR